MASALGLRRAAAVGLVGLSLTLGCGRWQPTTSHDVATQTDPHANYAVVLGVAQAKEYAVVSKDDATLKVKLKAHSDSKSFIVVTVYANEIRLEGAGALVRDDKIHKLLATEIGKLERELNRQVNSGVAMVAAPAAPAPATGAAAGGPAPSAWTEPAYDPSVWGNGNFTCLPLRVPAEHQSALTLQLTNGEKADLQLSLAYDAGLCRSPAQCKQAGGCPALGIGDAERVSRIAGRLSRGEIGPQAVLLDAGTPVATIDLAHHGSIQQALSEIKK
jgi:hypothetical protein